MRGWHGKHPSAVSMYIMILTKPVLSSKAVQRIFSLRNHIKGTGIYKNKLRIIKHNQKKRQQQQQEKQQVWLISCTCDSCNC